jgi:hypothetical protein
MGEARAVLVAAVAAGWAAWLVVVPVIAAAGPAGLAAWPGALTYRAGAVICHQQDARSLHVAGVRMPVCARCFGLYAGGGAGALLAAAWVYPGRRPKRLPLARSRVVVIACALPTLAAWVGEHAVGLAVPGAARATLAFPLGAAVAAVVTLWAGGATFEDAAPATALHS